MVLGRLVASSLLAGLFAISTAHAADIRDRTIKVGIGLSADHPQGQAVARFAEIVSQKSGGKIKVRLFAGGALGNDVTMISALQGGTQEMTIPDTSTLVGISGLKDFGLINLPFLFQNGQEADALLDGPFGQKLMAKLPEKGLIGFGFWENGFRQVTNSRRPITKAEDFAGLKLRVIQNPLFIDTFRELGANAVPMPFTEVYTALETKTIDGQENPLATILASKFYEVQKHTVMSNHIYSVWAFLMSKRFWDKLTPDEQALITDAANEAKDFERKTIRDFEKTALEELKAKGMEVTTLSDDEMAKLREKTKAVRDKFTEEFGKDSATEMMSEIERVRSGKK
ncbi:TRAP transporter substrate-binding protein [Microvirga subterranea]|uniref:Tripartite ATP-independent transporter DctP family solute receptor n=1 Tax=Microvirga subterranea TaxID=186651 RepID=A0A370HMV0_9HYPH|nr:TRAP transporter substrate-binding protein [Microvirga subterranea]RDI59555.1 tripartite ATP-independent transporter DctP family solute receptor [Microvirga subterranea]